MSFLRRFSFALSCCVLGMHAGAVHAESPREGKLQLTAELSLPPMHPQTVASEVATGETPVQEGLQATPPKQMFTLPQPAVAVQEDAPRIATIDLTTPPDDLLQRLRNGFSMPDLHSPLVAERQAWFLNNPNYIKRVLERSKRYMHHIVTELEKRGMPTELALLPIVESSYNPLAYSRAKALGMWQFIPSTGKNYKLQQNWWMDERRDIIASTAAALDYLQTIYEMHGDWHLALASYNWGEGAVARAIAKNRAKGLPTDYVNLTMPGETRYYVPKLQAIKNIIARPEVFGIALDPMPNKPYFGTVEKPGDLDVSLAAKLAEIPVDEFIALNPAYQRPVIPGDSKSPLVLPADKVATFRLNLENHEASDKPLSAWNTYKFKKGDKLEKIADKYDISVSHLKQLNGIGPRTKVTPGFSLLIPGKDAPRAGQLAALDAKLPDPPAEPASATATVCSKDKKGRKVCKTTKVKGGKEAGKKNAAKAGKGTPKSAKPSKGKPSKAAAKPAKQNKKR